MNGENGTTEGSGNRNGEGMALGLTPTGETIDHGHGEGQFGDNDFEFGGPGLDSGVEEKENVQRDLLKAEVGDFSRA